MEGDESCSIWTRLCTTFLLRNEVRCVLLFSCKRRGRRFAYFSLAGECVRVNVFELACVSDSFRGLRYFSEENHLDGCAYHHRIMAV